LELFPATRSRVNHVLLPFPVLLVGGFLLVEDLVDVARRLAFVATPLREETPAGVDTIGHPTARVSDLALAWKLIERDPHPTTLSSVRAIEKRLRVPAPIKPTDDGFGTDGPDEAEPALHETVEGVTFTRSLALDS